MNKDFIIEETDFDPNKIGKYETILSLGNGYMGLRAATEENHHNRHYGLFIGGTFHTSKGDEVPELPNMADLINMNFWLNDENFNLLTGKISRYKRYLDIKKGELVRELEWTSNKGHRYEFSFRSYLSFESIHTIFQNVKIKALSHDTSLNLQVGINAQITNSGTQHFEDYDTRYYKQKVQQYILKTEHDNIFVYTNRGLKLFLDNKELKVENSLLSVYGYDRRKIYQNFNIKLNKGQELELLSISSIYTTRDFDFNSQLDYEKVLEVYGEDIINKLEEGYWLNFANHTKVFEKQIWNELISIKTKDSEIALYVNLAQYHMYKFTPQFDNRLNIDAKGWVGEEYKGHSFWDTEIYILPNYIYLNPKKARVLLEHRYFLLPSALKKAKENGFKGAMWPWETSWENDGETCPRWGEVDFKTGKRMKVWAGINELHISVDIMWAINLYYKNTNDFDFMEKYGLEMLFLTSIFWSEKSKKNRDNLYEIKEVTGPNEYKENINNNFFTNFMVKEMLNETLKWVEFLKENNNNLLENLNRKTNIKYFLNKLEDISSNMYLLKKDTNNIYPENDTFNKLSNLLEISKFKKQKGLIWHYYTSDDLNKYKVLKQADVVCLLYTMFDKFSKEEIFDNWKYYESITLHASSLSLSMHSLTASMIKEQDLAYDFFKKSCEIDFGKDTNSSNDGIHTAATGGIIKSIVEGFAGLRFIGNTLTINPSVPKEIEQLEFVFWHKKNKYKFKVDKENIEISIVNFNSEDLILINNIEQKILPNYFMGLKRW